MDEKKPTVGRDSAGRFLPGCGGRPKGSKNKRTLLQEELEKDGPALANVIKSKALEGDMTAARLWVERMAPALRQRGETVEFELDMSASLSAQCAQVIEAVSNGELSIDDAKQITDMIRQLAEVRSLENGGSDDKAAVLVEHFKRMAQLVEGPGIPYKPPRAAEPDEPQAPQPTLWQ